MKSKAEMSSSDVERYGLEVPRHYARANADAMRCIVIVVIKHYVKDADASG